MVGWIWTISNNDRPIDKPANEPECVQAAGREAIDDAALT